MSRGNKIAFQIIFWLYVAGVLFLCFGHFDSTPSVPLDFFGIPTDKIVHFTMFFPFPILAFLAFDRFTDSVKSTLLFTGATFIVGLILAFGTEWGQAHFTEYRSGDPMDLLADTLALFLSSVLVIVVDIVKQRKSSA
jgi:VanZ family protein